MTTSAALRRGALLETAPAPSRRRVVLVLGALIALGPATIDMYLPTLGNDLSATPAQVQLTLTGTLVGPGLGELVLGPVSNAVGRRLPVLLGTAVHVVASVLCIVAPTVGGELLRLTDWRGVFGALAVLGVLLLVIAARALPETLPPSRRRAGGVVGTARAYRGLLRDRSYVGLVLVAGTAWISV